MELPLPPGLKEKALTVEETEELKRLIEEMPVRGVTCVPVPLVQYRCQDCEANKTLARVRALLERWEKEHGASATMACRIMRRELEAAIDGSERKG